LILVEDAFVEDEEGVIHEDVLPSLLELQVAGDAGPLLLGLSD
jgi:hypothetical protein